MTSVQRPPARPAAAAYDAPYPADLDRRFYAYAIDRAIGWGLGAGVGALLWWVFDQQDALVVAGAVVGTIVAVSLVFAVLQGTSGATPGKSALGIRSVKEATGRQPGVGGALLRAVILGLAGLPTAGLGIATLAWTAAMDADGRRRGWHDLVTGTLVTDVRRRPDADNDDVVEAPRAIVNLTAMRLMPAPEPVRQPQAPAPRRTPGSPELATDPALRRPEPSTPARGNQPWPLDGATRQAQPAQQQPVPPPAPTRQVPPAQPVQQPAPPMPQTGPPPAAPRPPAKPFPAAPARPPQQSAQQSAQQAGQAHRSDGRLSPDHQPTGRRPDVPPAHQGPVQPNVQAPQLPTPPANRPGSGGQAGAPAGATAAASGASAPVSRWRVTFDTGESFVVDGLALVGRGPQPRPGEAVRHLVPLRSTDMSLSKTHAQFHVARDGVLVVMDRGSTNGSVIIRKGMSRELAAGRPATLVDGDRVKFGDREMVVARES